MDQHPALAWPVPFEHSRLSGCKVRSIERIDHGVCLKAWDVEPATRFIPTFSIT